MKYIKLLLALLSLYLCNSCAINDEDLLFPATEIGMNTLACKVDGVPFNASAGGTKQVGASYYSDKKELFISASISPERTVYFRFKYDGGIGKYTNINNVIAGTNSYVQITRFSDNIVSGYFQITSYQEILIKLEKPNEYKYDTVIAKFTEGRFDIKTKF